MFKCVSPQVSNEQERRTAGAEAAARHSEQEEEVGDERRGKPTAVPAVVAVTRVSDRTGYRLFVGL